MIQAGMGGATRAIVDSGGKGAFAVVVRLSFWGCRDLVFRAALRHRRFAGDGDVVAPARLDHLMGGPNGILAVLCMK